MGPARYGTDPVRLDMVASRSIFRSRFSQKGQVTIFDETYGEEAVLKDGTPVTLRLVRPTDKELILDGWERLSAESRYRRFLSPKRVLSGAELRYLTELDQVDHLAIGAAVDRGGTTQGLGVARFVRVADRPDSADVAVTVVDDAQRNGLGRLLLSRLIDAARERGIERFVCDLLATNDAMRALIRNLVPGAIERIDGPTSHVEMPLGGVATPACSVGGGPDRAGLRALRPRLPSDRKDIFSISGATGVARRRPGRLGRA